MVKLEDIKNALGVTGTYQDATLQIYMNEVIAFLVDAGVMQSNITSGIVARGVSDLWNYGAGDGSLSEYFKTRACQLALKKGVNEIYDPDDPDTWEYTTDADIDSLF